MNFFLVTFFLVFWHRWTDRQTDRQTGGQKVTHKSPPCMSTGGLKKYQFLKFETLTFDLETMLTLTFDLEMTLMFGLEVTLTLNWP